MHGRAQRPPLRCTWPPGAKEQVPRKPRVRAASNVGAQGAWGNIINDDIKASAGRLAQADRGILLGHLAAHADISQPQLLAPAVSATCHGDAAQAIGGKLLAMPDGPEPQLSGTLSAQGRAAPNSAPSEVFIGPIVG